MKRNRHTDSPGNDGDARNVRNYHYTGTFYGASFGENSNVNNLGNANRERTWEEVFAWLTQGRADLNYIPVHDDTYRRCKPDLGQWFLNADNFHSWSTGGCRTLFCYGARGIGKTMLVSVATEYLISRSTAENPKTLVLVCYLSSQHTHSHEAYLAALLGQILQRRRQFSSTTRSLCAAKMPLNSRASPQDLLTSFIDEIADVDRVFILVDALDEVQPQTRLDLMKILNSLVSTAPKVHLLLTSYLKESWTVGEEHSSCWELTVPDTVVRTFVDDSVRERYVIHSLVSDDPQDRSELVEILTQKAAGLVLLANMQLDLIEAQDPQLRDELFELANDLSSTLGTIYRKLLSQIESQKDSPRKNAHRIIMWLAVAQRELPIDLIKHAIRLADNSNVSLEKKSLLATDKILACCKGLVIHQKSKDTVSFTHPTAFEFFADNLDSLYVGQPSPYTLIAHTILHQLEYIENILSRHEDLQEESVIQCYTDYPLLGYTYTDLRCVYDKADDHFRISYKNLFSGSTDGSRVATLFLWRAMPREFRKTQTWRSASVLHIAAALGIPTILREAHNAGDSIDVLDDQGYSPLRWAVGARASVIVDLLHDLGATFADQDHRGLTTLVWALGASRQTETPAVRVKHVNVVDDTSLLLGNAIQMDPRSAQASQLGNPLHPIRTDVAILRKLVEFSRLNDLQANSRLLMSLACSKRLGIVVTALVEAGITIPSDALLTAILASSTSYEIGKVLLSENAEAIIGCAIRIDEAAWRSGQMKSDILSSDDGWMRLLVTDETMKYSGPRNREPLSMAAEMGLFHVCDALIENGADVGHVDLDGWTPLMWAAVRPKFTKIHIGDCVVKGNAAALFGAVVEVKGDFMSQQGIYQDLDLGAMSENKCRIISLLDRCGAEIALLEPRHSRSAYQMAIKDNMMEVADRLALMIKTRYKITLTEHRCISPSASPTATSLPASSKFRWNWVSTGRSCCCGNARFFCCGDTGDMTVADNAHVFYEAPNAKRSDATYLPEVVLQAIFSSIQLHIENIVVSDNAQVYHGRVIRGVDEFASNRPSSFFRSWGQNDAGGIANVLASLRVGNVRVLNEPRSRSNNTLQANLSNFTVIDPND